MLKNKFKNNLLLFNMVELGLISLIVSTSITFLYGIKKIIKKIRKSSCNMNTISGNMNFSYDTNDEQKENVEK